MKKLLILALFALPAFSACNSGLVSIVDPFLNPDGTAWTGSITYTFAYNAVNGAATTPPTKQQINVVNGLSLCLIPGLYQPVVLQQSGQRNPVTTQWGVRTGGPYTYAQIAASATFTSTLQAGASIFVDAVYGNDSTGQRGNAGFPFKTFRAAIAATGITSGDMISFRPGTYDESASPDASVIPPDGVSVSCAPGTHLINKQTGVTFLVSFQPGSNSSWNGCFVDSGQTAVTPVSATIGYCTSLCVGVHSSTNVSLVNITAAGGSDVLYFRSSASPSLHPVTYWSVTNSVLTSPSDDTIAVIQPNSDPVAWPIVVDVFGSTITGSRRVVNNAAPTGIVNVYGGKITVNGDSTGPSAAIYNQNSAVTNVFGPSLIGSGSNYHVIWNKYSPNSTVGQIITVYPGTAYNPSTVLNESGSGAGSIVTPLLVPPTSCTGQLTGTLWNNSGTAGFCP